MNKYIVFFKGDRTLHKNNYDLAEGVRHVTLNFCSALTFGENL